MQRAFVLLNLLLLYCLLWRHRCVTVLLSSWTSSHSAHRHGRASCRCATAFIPRNCLCSVFLGGLPLRVSSSVAACSCASSAVAGLFGGSCFPLVFGEVVKVLSTTDHVSQVHFMIAARCVLCSYVPLTNSMRVLPCLTHSIHMACCLPG